MSQSTAFHFRRFLRLVGLRWTYFNPPSRWATVVLIVVNITTDSLSPFSLEAHDQVFFLSDNFRSLEVFRLSDERKGLQFTLTVASGPCQRNHSLLELQQNS
jgi:hypothetical protein